MEVYNICSFSYVGSLRDGYFWAVFGYFARLVSRSIVTNRKNFQRPGFAKPFTEFERGLLWKEETKISSGEKKK